MFWTQFLGAFNDNLFKNALTILALFTGARVFGIPPEQLVPLAAGVFILPFFLFSAVAGEYSDKVEKSRLLRRIKGLELAVMAVAAVAFLTEQLGLGLVALFGMGTQSALFGPAKYSILPQLLDDEDLVEGNALVEVATYLAILVGTLVGGLLITVEVAGHPVGIWAVSASMIAVAMVGYLTATRIPKVPITDPVPHVRWSPLGPTRDVLRIAASKRSVWLSILGITWFWAFGSAFLSLFPVYAKNVLGGDPGVATSFLAMFSCGIAAGSLICSRLSRHRLELGLVPIGAAGMSLFCLDLFWVGQPWAVVDGQSLGMAGFLSTLAGWRILFDLFMVSAFGGMYIVPLYTLIQKRSDPAQRSRVIAANNIVNSFFMVAMSLALIAAQGLGLTPWQIFGILAVLNAIASLYIFWQVPEFLIRFLAWTLSNVLYRVNVVGRENLPEDGACVIAANHVSFVDFLVLGGALQRPTHFLMDASFTHYPFMGWFRKNEICIPIASPRRDPDAYAQAFVSVRRKLCEGRIVGIFPEGKLTSDGSLAPFKAGIEKIIDRDPVPVVPIAIHGLWGSWFSRKRGNAMAGRPRRFRAEITIQIGAPISPEHLTSTHLHTRVQSLLSEAAT
jgi:1-acyl-sn-glycerol-3-phosphate acyltransferase